MLVFSKHHFRKSSGIFVKDPISKPDCSCFTKLKKEAQQLKQLLDSQHKCGTFSNRISRYWKNPGELFPRLSDNSVDSKSLKTFRNGLALAYTWIKANQGSKRLYLLSEVKGKPFLALFDLVKKVSLLFMQKLRRPGGRDLLSNWFSSSLRLHSLFGLKHDSVLCRKSIKLPDI